MQSLATGEWVNHGTYHFPSFDTIVYVIDRVPFGDGQNELKIKRKSGEVEMVNNFNDARVYDKTKMHAFRDSSASVSSEELKRVGRNEMVDFKKLNVEE